MEWRTSEGRTRGISSARYTVARKVYVPDSFSVSNSSTIRTAQKERVGISRSTPDDSLKVGVGGQHYMFHSIEVADEFPLSPPALVPPPPPVDLPKKR